LKKTDVVSGGSYGLDDFYYDYTMPMRSHHHIELTTLDPCYSLTTVATFCSNSCPRNTSTDHTLDKAKSMSSYEVGPTPCDTIKKEIFNYSSVIADFKIYEDFLT
jgi:hypothetical protein